MTDQVEAIRDLVIQKIRIAAGEGHDLENVQDDFSLVESGFLDSVGFVDLVAALETEFDIEIDFAEFDPEEFMTLGGIVQCSVQAIMGGTDQGGPGAGMREFRPASELTSPDELVPQVLPCLQAAGHPYYDYVFGGPDAARGVLERWMRRSSSEIALDRAILLLEGSAVLGGYIAMEAADLRACRSADAIAMTMVGNRAQRTELRQRLVLLGDLFAPIEEQAFYLSKVWVAPAQRGRGLAWELMLAYIADGRERHYERFVLDVSALNKTAIGIYRGIGFEVFRDAECPEANIRYFSMAVSAQDVRADRPAESRS